MQPSNLSTEAYQRACGVFKVLVTPVVQHILTHMEIKRDVLAREMITSLYSYATILKYIRKLEQFKLVRRDRLGTEVTYKLNYDRLDKINLAATQL